MQKIDVHVLVILPQHGNALDLTENDIRRHQDPGAFHQLAAIGLSRFVAHTEMHMQIDAAGIDDARQWRRIIVTVQIEVGEAIQAVECLKVPYDTPEHNMELVFKKRLPPPSKPLKTQPVLGPNVYTSDPEHPKFWESLRVFVNTFPH